MTHFDSNQLIPRDALMKRLDGASDRRLIYIHAPGGYGKTVTAKLWVERRKKSGTVYDAQIRFDEYDNAITIFCRRFCRALSLLQPDNAKLQSFIAHPSFNSSPDEFTLSIIDSFNEFCEVTKEAQISSGATLPSENPEPQPACGSDKYILTLDDLHVITNKEILKHFLDFLNRMSLSFTVIILSRAAIPDIFSKMVIENTAAVIDIDDLRFSRNEIHTFFAKSGRRVTRAQSDDIFASTGGWPIGLKAVLLSSADSYAIKPTARFFEAYLKEYIWANWDEKTQDSLLKVSVVNSFTAELFEALTGAGRGEEFLSSLLRENSFLRVDANGFYSFHDLFRDFLTHMAQKNGKAFWDKQLKAAGDWYFEQKDYYKAVDFYARCRDINQIARSVDLMYISHKSPYASVEDTVNSVRKVIDEAVLSRHPFCLEPLIWVAFVDGCPDDMKNYYDRYWTALPKIIIKNPRSLLTSMLLKILDYRNGFADVLANIKVPPFGRFKNVTTISLTQNMPFFHRSFRDFTEFASDTEHKLTLFRKTLRNIFINDYDIVEHSIRAGIAYERSDLDAALRHSQNAIAATTKEAAPEIWFCAYMIHAAALWASDNTGDATRVPATVDALIEQHGAYFLKANLRAFHTRLKLSAGSVETAREWLLKNDEPDHQNPTFYKFYRHFTTVRALIVTGDYHRSIMLSLKLLALAKNYRRTIDVIEAHILLAIAHHKLPRGGTDAAFSHLIQAMRTAHVHGYTQIFISEGADLLTMLHKLMKQSVQADFDGGIPASFIKSLYIASCAAAKGSKGMAAERTSETLNFTKRQQAVMRLMREGHSRNEIARIMDISPDGVKSHMKLIFRKLDVASSAEAAVKIVELGL
ncbi:MAG: LuxR C-terminal-related transcriptional regulator [Oscillospiraceae bacterium]|nr:LuxR C-terminal-related transcriptional regulator [Oscillospiraceae bacterium]